MKLLVFGHSDSDGSQLSNSSDGIPWVLQRILLDAAGIEAEVIHRHLYPGPSAAGFVQKQLDTLQPEVVVLATTTHNVTVRLVSNAVRERWGERAAGRARSAELWAARVHHSAPEALRPVVSAGRRAARRLLGTRPLMTSDDLVRYYSECMAQLARVENLHTIIGGGIGYIGEIRQLNPGIEERQAELQRRFRELAEAHHFDWLSHEAVLGGLVAKEPYYLPDGMHTNADSHRLFAEALLPLLLARR